MINFYVHLVELHDLDLYHSAKLRDHCFPCTVVSHFGNICTFTHQLLSEFIPTV